MTLAADQRGPPARDASPRPPVVRVPDADLRRRSRPRSPAGAGPRVPTAGPPAAAAAGRRRGRSGPRARPGASSRGAGGSNRCLSIRTSSTPPRNGSRPVRASKSITPTLYQSLAGETGRPAACSGAMYAAVPTRCPSVLWCWPVLVLLGDQAEVEQHDPALARHDHVRRLDVAVQLAGRVERRDPLGELPQGRAEPGRSARRHRPPCGEAGPEGTGARGIGLGPPSRSGGARAVVSGRSRPPRPSVHPRSPRRWPGGLQWIRALRRADSTGVSSRTYRRKSTPSSSSIVRNQFWPSQISS